MNRNDAMEDLAVGQTILFSSETQHIEGVVTDITDDKIELSEAFDIDAMYRFSMPLTLPFSMMIKYEILDSDMSEGSIDIDKSVNTVNSANTKIRTPAPQQRLPDHQEVNTCSNIQIPTEKNGMRPQFEKRVTWYGVPRNTTNPAPPPPVLPRLPSNATKPKEENPQTDASRIQRLERLVTNQLRYINYFNCTEDKYFDAINYLDSFAVIGFYCASDFGEGLFKTSMFIFSTPRMVYVFDILQIGGVPKELKTLLTSSWPQKAVYNKQRLNKHLQKRHGFELKSAFDTLLGHRKITRRNENVSLIKLVKIVCRIKLDEDEHPNDSFKRPLTQERLENYAKKAIYLLKIYEIMSFELMGPMYLDSSEPKPKTAEELEDLYAPESVYSSKQSEASDESSRYTSYESISEQSNANFK